MLSPETRTVAMSLLRPPSGYRLDTAFLTTYTLDLEALLALPLGVLAQADGDVESLLGDPLLLIEALREAQGRIHVFVDRGGIAVPPTHRDLYGMLDSCVHPVRAQGGGVFHPKVWAIRFVKSEGEGAAPLLRAGVMSRNLTFDRSWDVALTSEASTVADSPVEASRPLGDLLRALPELAVDKLPQQLPETARELAAQVERSKFPAPPGFESPVTFHLLGAGTNDLSPWPPTRDAVRLLAMAPFVGRSALDALTRTGQEERLLVSTQEALDQLSEDALGHWADEYVWVLTDLSPEDVDGMPNERPVGLHAKILALEGPRTTTWYVGSANLTGPAFQGANVEMMASVTGPTGTRSGGPGFGIDRFLDSGFRKLCSPYLPSEEQEEEEDEAAALAAKSIAKAGAVLLDAPLRASCRLADGAWRWALDTRVALALPEGVDAAAWPVTITEAAAQRLEPPLEWRLETRQLTAFAAFRLSVAHEDVEDVRLTRKLPVEGMPEGRTHAVLRSLIDSPDKFLRLLRALLGGLEGMVDWARSGTQSNEERSPWGTGSAADTLLEDLLRAASRDPKRLRPVRRLVEELSETDGGRTIVPDDLLAAWNALEEAIGERER